MCFGRLLYAIMAILSDYYYIHRDILLVWCVNMSEIIEDLYIVILAVIAGVIIAEGVFR